MFLRMHRKRAHLVHAVVEFHSNEWKNGAPGPSLDDIEEPLNSALTRLDLGSCMGQRWLPDGAGFELDLVLRPDRLDEATAVVAHKLRNLGVPADTVFRTLGTNEAQVDIYPDGNRGSS